MKTDFFYTNLIISKTQISKNNGFKSKNLICLVLWWNINIPNISPKAPPKKENEIKHNSLILLFFLIAKNLSTPIRINDIELIIIK